MFSQQAFPCRLFRSDAHVQRVSLLSLVSGSPWMNCPYGNKETLPNCSPSMLALTGGLDLAIEGPSKAEISCIDNKDGTCTVTYLPTLPGDYSILVKYNDKHIPGSPFTAKITGRGRLSSCWNFSWEVKLCLTYPHLIRLGWQGSPLVSGETKSRAQAASIPPFLIMKRKHELPSGKQALSHRRQDNTDSRVQELSAEAD